MGYKPSRMGARWALPPPWAPACRVCRFHVVHGAQGQRRAIASKVTPQMATYNQTEEGRADSYEETRSCF